MGVLAQEVEVFPELVSEGDNEMAVNYQVGACANKCIERTTKRNRNMQR